MGIFSISSGKKEELVHFQRHCIYFLAFDLLIGVGFLASSVNLRCSEAGLINDYRNGSEAYAHWQMIFFASGLFEDGRYCV